LDRKDEKPRDIQSESNTNDNEIELIEFSINKALYGINVAKVKEIIKADIDILSIPDTHPSIQGAINLRGKIIPVLSLAQHLKEKVLNDKVNNRIIISEFNKRIVGFLVSAVYNIIPISYTQIEEPSEIIQSEEGYINGIIRIEEKVILLLDFEKIVGHINPNASILPSMEEENLNTQINRSSKTILIAEDSNFVRDLIVSRLTSVGYKVLAVNNGKEAWEHIQQIISTNRADDIEDHFQLLITDIEMPQMDGLLLVKNIKKNIKTKKIPCIAFSSILSNDLIEKCKKAGTDGEISKADIKNLIELIEKKII